MSKTLCFTGHRPNKICSNFSEDSHAIRQLKMKIETQIVDCIFNGFDTFLTGMAIGSDIICAEIVLKLKQLHPHLKLIACVPFEGQEKSFSLPWKARYYKILSECDDVLILAKGFKKDVYSLRNQYMVDHSELTIAIFNGDTHSGTSQTINFTKSQNKEVIIIKTPSSFNL